MKKTKTLKIVKTLSGILIDVIVYAFLIFSLIIALTVLLSNKSKDGAVDVFGYELRTVLTDSMEESSYTDVSGYDIKSLPKNTLLLIKTVPETPNANSEWYSALKVGDVLTINYVYDRNTIITHRITSIKEKKSGGYLIELSGDNKDSDFTTLIQVIDTSLIDSPNYVIGKVVKSSQLFGTVLNSLKNPVYMVLSITLPCLIIVIYQVFKILILNYKNKLRLKEQEIARLQSELNKINFKGDL